MILPTKDENGIPYLSSTQIDKFTELKSFNLKVEGVLEYILHYFLKEKFEDIGWAEFGHDVEEAIVTKDYGKFTSQEVETLEKIEVFDKTQYEVRINFDDFYLKGYIDTIDAELTKLKDYKTASATSKDKYYKDEYVQILYYGIGIKEQTGNYPEMEVEIIERNGNAFRGGRPALSVGKEIWRVKKELTEEKEKELREYIQKIANEISEYYQVFLKLNV